VTNLLGTQVHLNFPDYYAPFRVESSDEDEEDRLTHAQFTVERASENYMTALVQVNPHLCAKNHTLVRSVKDEGEVKDNRHDMARRRAEQENYFAKLQKFSNDLEDSDDPVLWSWPTANNHETDPFSEEAIPILSILTPPCQASRSRLASKFYVDVVGNLVYC
jgi:hypothetical protein